MKTKNTPKKEPNKKDKDKKILEMSNLLLQRNIDVYRKLASE